MPRYCLTLDLKKDPIAIQEYRLYHEKIWPEVKESLIAAGIQDMEIYIFETRLMMIMDVDESFSFEAKAASDEANDKVQEWEALMGRLQADPPPERKGQKWRWMRMERVFSLALQ